MAPLVLMLLSNYAIYTRLWLQVHSKRFKHRLNNLNSLRSIEAHVVRFPVPHFMGIFWNWGERFEGCAQLDLTMTCAGYTGKCVLSTWCLAVPRLQPAMAKTGRGPCREYTGTILQQQLNLPEGPSTPIERHYVQNTVPRMAFGA